MRERITAIIVEKESTSRGTCLWNGKVIKYSGSSEFEYIIGSMISASYEDGADELASYARPICEKDCVCGGTVILDYVEMKWGNRTFKLCLSCGQKTDTTSYADRAPKVRDNSRLHDHGDKERGF
jgi:hypothetical protein